MVYTIYMRILGILLSLIIVLPASADVDVKQGLMSANIDSKPLEQVLEILKRQTSISFTIDESARTSLVSASFQQLPIAEGIKKLLDGTTYTLLP